MRNSDLIFFYLMLYMQKFLIYWMRVFTEIFAFNRVVKLAFLAQYMLHILNVMKSSILFNEFEIGH